MEIRSIRDLVFHLESLPVVGKCQVVAIDGCGGAGKSTFASALCALWPGSAIVHTDDFASWDNQTAWWPRLRELVLEPLSRGEAATFQKFDWAKNEMGEWETVRTNRLILEGVSSSRLEFRPYLAYSLWIETPRDERLRRGLERDGESMLPQWETWMAGEDVYVAEHRPMDFVDLVLSGDDAFRFMNITSL